MHVFTSSKVFCLVSTTVSHSLLADFKKNVGNKQTPNKKAKNEQYLPKVVVPVSPGQTLRRYLQSFVLLQKLLYSILVLSIN